MRLPVPVRRVRLVVWEFFLNNEYVVYAAFAGVSMGLASYWMLSILNQKVDCLDGVQRYTYTRVADGKQITLHRSCK